MDFMGPCYVYIHLFIYSFSRSNKQKAFPSPLMVNEYCDIAYHGENIVIIFLAMSPSPSEFWKKKN